MAHWLREPHRRFRRGIIGFLFVSLIGITSAGINAWASFTGGPSGSTAVSTGTLTVSLAAGGTATNRLTINASTLAAGDTVQRAFDVANSGNGNWSGLTMTTTASPSSLLDTDATNGLQMVVDDCSVAWTEAGVAPAYTYTCSGTKTTDIASRGVIGSALAVGNAPNVQGATTHYRTTLTFPAADGNTYQNLTSTILYSFTATQRAAFNGASYNLFGAVAPASSIDDTGSATLGVRFTSDIAGSVTGVRFYKPAGAVSTHVVNLWNDSTHASLASATSSGETASGWQYVAFASPVAITAGTTYDASFYASDAFYAYDSHKFDSAFNNVPLHVPVAGGVYTYAVGATFPSSSFNNTSYGVDVALTSPSGD